MGRIDYETETMIVTSEDVSPTLMSGSTSPAAHGKKNGTDREALVVCVTGQVAHTLKTDGFDENVSAPLTCSQRSAVAVRDISPTLTSNYGKQLDRSDTALGPNVVFPNARVRRLTPRECEKLQGFPPDYTAIPKAADGPRYKALGNSMAVPVMRWIGQSIDYAMLWSPS